MRSNENEAGAPLAATDAERPTATHWRMVSVLCLVNAIAFIDRTALPLLVQPIRRDLQISDTAISLLIGAAFILTYAFGGMFVGALVDRLPRRKVLAGGITLWGLATMFCGTVTNYAALFGGRCAVGAGEATCGPASMSLIKDTFDARFRGRAVAIWAMGASIGAGVALLTGGAILHVVGDAGTIEMALLGTVRGWQLVLMACGAIALPVALLLFTFPEPRRRTGTRATTVREALRTVRDRWPVFLPLFVANAATIMLSAGYATWIPALLGRTWHISAGEIGLTYGMIVLVLSTTSQFAAGFLIDFIFRRRGLAAIPLVGGGICFCVIFLAFIIPRMPSLASTWIVLACFNLLTTSLFTIGTATVVHLTPPQAVGTVTGVHFAWVGITGSAVAPTLIATLSDRVFAGSANPLASSLSTAGTTLAVIGCVGLFATGGLLLAEGAQCRQARTDARTDVTPA